MAESLHPIVHDEMLCDNLQTYYSYPRVTKGLEVVNKDWDYLAFNLTSRFVLYFITAKNLVIINSIHLASKEIYPNFFAQYRAVYTHIHTYIHVFRSLFSIKYET